MILKAHWKITNYIYIYYNFTLEDCNFNKRKGIIIKKKSYKFSTAS